MDNKPTFTPMPPDDNQPQFQPVEPQPVSSQPQQTQNEIEQGFRYPTAPQPIQTYQPPQPADTLPQPYQAGQMPPQPQATQPLVDSSGKPLFAPDPASTPQFASPSTRKRKAGLLVSIFAAVLLIVGGSAAAYFGIIVPNKPENQIAKALQNTLKQKYVTAKIDGDIKDGDSPAFKFSSTIKSDVASKALSADLNLVVTGVTIPLEVRYVDESAYVKVGDVTTILKLLVASLGGTTDSVPLLTQLNKKISNQWIAVDSTILKETGVSGCSSALDLKSEDYKALDKLYKKYPFMNIGKISKDTVDGNAATKYELTIDDNTGADFIDGLQELPSVKKSNDCLAKAEGAGSENKIDQELSKESPTDSLRDNDKTPLTLWIDKKSKLITKIESHSTEQDAKKGTTGKLSGVMNYSKVTIEKPEKSVPFADYFLDLSTLLGADATVLGDRIDLFTPN